ncbi:MAG: hypothetical protein A2086_15725 [Spirochaetes bacterium GWD1_27_9]|nr:MAG: hypothetical protein A2Z98_10995 [Spirochaetes bacterium GWB1_27_13]OHD42830.1 MAG: hypothetical protein A2086_15725 [Spirochaetes bacterium GWD1_27_9]
MQFNGFSTKTFDFLKNLGENNNKMWFEEHKDDYKEYLVKPLQELVVSLGGTMLEIDKDFVTIPAINKTISRINKDVRFSKDKSLYKTNMWITFKRESDNWKEEPCYFFEIFTDWYRHGVGFYTATSKTMDNLRLDIENKNSNFLEIYDIFSKQNTFTIEGDKYKRILNKNITTDLQDWYQRKTIFFVCNSKITESVYSSDLLEKLKRDFKLLEPIYNYLWKIKG